MKHAVLIYLIALLAANSHAAAQDGPETSIQHTVQGEAGKDIRVGVYVNVQPDCTSGSLPVIRLSGQPAHGKVVVKKAHVTATNYKQCLALAVSAYVALYRSEKNFSGTDHVNIEVSYPAGRREVQHITINVQAAGSRQPI